MKIPRQLVEIISDLMSQDDRKNCDWLLFKQFEFSSGFGLKLLFFCDIRLEIVSTVSFVHIACTIRIFWTYFTTFVLWGKFLQELATEIWWTLLLRDFTFFFIFFFFFFYPNYIKQILILILMQKVNIKKKK